MGFMVAARGWRCRLGVAATLAVASSWAAATMAGAAPGDPFTCNPGLVFLAQGVPTQLEALVDGPGTATFTNIGGTTAGLSYNSLGYNPVDNFLYAMTTSPPAGSLLRIDSTGAVTNLGPPAGGPPVGTNIGTFGPTGTYYVGVTGSATLYLINVVTNTRTALPLSATIGAADLTFANGFLWGIHITTGDGIRINPTTGAVTTFAQTALPAPFGYGANWTYGNGNLGFSNNATGAVVQVRILNPASATPSYQLVKTSAGPSSGNNDGASCAGPPADLQLLKSGPTVVGTSSTITWTIYVTNNGAGASSGFAVNDPIPAGITNVATSTPGCTVTAAPAAVACAEGPLAAGSTFTITVTGTAPLAAGPITNTASVTGNEADPNLSNDTASTTTAVANIAGIPIGTPLSLVAVALSALGLVGWRRKLRPTAR